MLQSLVPLTKLQPVSHRFYLLNHSLVRSSIAVSTMPQFEVQSQFPQVKKLSKHCRTCNRFVEGFDHHCSWLNNYIGKKNYTTFFLLMIFILLMCLLSAHLIIEGGTAIAIIIRCFVDKRGIEKELHRQTI